MARKTRMGRIHELIGLVDDIDEQLKDDSLRVNQKNRLKIHRKQHMGELLNLRTKHHKIKK
jgi:hypothetical protein